MNRPVYTVRVTQMESFRNWMHNQNEHNEMWNTENRVVETISGQYTGSVKADFGTSGHNIIEDQALHRLPNGGYKVGDYTFTAKQVQPVIDYTNEHPLMVREIPVSKLYHCRAFDIIVTGTVDAIEGLFVRDNKFKFSSFTVQEYMDSAQHRFYLDMLGLDHFFYDFFRVKGFETMADLPKAKISEVETIHVSSYPEMREDLHNWLYEFEDWVTFKGYLPWLTITKAKYNKIIAGDYRLKKLIA